jgi:hypothetical protein
MIQAINTLGKGARLLADRLLGLCIGRSLCLQHATHPPFSWGGIHQNTNKFRDPLKSQTHLQTQLLVVHPGRYAAQPLETKEMTHSKLLLKYYATIAASLLVVLTAAPVQAAESDFTSESDSVTALLDEVTALRAEVQDLRATGDSSRQVEQREISLLRAEVKNLRAEGDQNWLNERRAEEVKGLIMEVLSDADMRASLAGDGAGAGHDGEHFFISAADDSFLMILSGQLQLQYIYNNQDEDTAPGGDDDDSGFQTRRAKIRFDGHVSSPKIGYHVELVKDWSSGNLVVGEYHVSHQLNDNVQLAGGAMKLPFLREFLVDSERQLAVERSTNSQFFSVGRSEGLRLQYSDGPSLLNVMVSDGANSAGAAFEDDTSEIAITARFDYLVQGDRSQLDDFTGWSGEESALNIGGAVHLEYGDSRNSGTDDYTAWTIDVQWEDGPLNAFAAWTAATIDPDASGSSDRDMDGLVVQGGVHIIPDKLELFARWASIDGDVSGEDDFDSCAVGFNYYINGHRTKLTADVIWLNEDAPTSNPFGDSVTTSRLGLISGDEDEMAVRAQVQLLF